MLKVGDKIRLLKDVYTGFYRWKENEIVEVDYINENVVLLQASDEWITDVRHEHFFEGIDYEIIEKETK